MDIVTRFLLATILITCGCQSKVEVTVDDQVEIISTDEFLKAAGEAYIYAYPMMLMDVTKGVVTNVPEPHPTKPLAPINQLGHFRELPDHTLTAVVKPNVDTYYSIAWFDLKEESYVLSMPATDRYYLLPFLDAYTNVFASPGTRTTGTDALQLLITGPDWAGDTPSGMTLIQSPTNMAWMLGRIQVNGPEDGATVVANIQNQMSLRPYKELHNANYIPPKTIIHHPNNEIIPVKELETMDVKSFFNTFAQLWKDNPPTKDDSLIVHHLRRIGLEPGQSFDYSTDNVLLKAKLDRMPAFVHDKMRERRAHPDPSMTTNGWIFITDGIGSYDQDYLRRAYVSFVGLGANLPEDAVYPNCIFDAEGHPLDASQNYTLHFDSDQLPPVHAFWSLTAYNEDEFLVENEISRYALGDRDDLHFNEDGSLDIYIQHEAPSSTWHQQNWLPIPEAGPFYLTLRLYWPKDVVLDGEWQVPGVVRQKS